MCATLPGTQFRGMWRLLAVLHAPSRGIQPQSPGQRFRSRELQDPRPPPTFRHSVNTRPVRHRSGLPHAARRSHGVCRQVFSLIKGPSQRAGLQSWNSAALASGAGRGGRSLGFDEAFVEVTGGAAIANTQDPAIPLLASHLFGRDTTSTPQINKEAAVKIMPPLSPPVR